MKAPQIPLRSFFRNPASRGYLLSPDGRMISLLKPWKSRLNIFVQAGPHGRAKRVTKETQRDIQDYFWKGNRYLIYSQDYTGGVAFHLYCIDVKSRQVRDLTPFKNVRAARIDDLGDVPEDEILITLNRRKQTLFDVYRLKVGTGKMRMVARNPGNVWRWIADNAGRIRAAISFEGENRNLLTRPGENAPFKCVRRMNFRRSIGRQFLSYTPDNKGIYAISQIQQNQDKAALVIISAATGREIRCLYQNPRVDVESFEVSKKRKVPTYASFNTSKQQRKILDRQTAAIFKTLTKKLRGYVVEITAQDKDEKKFIVATRNDRTPGGRYLFDASTRRLTKLAEVAPWLKEKNLAPVHPIQFKSRDGLTVHGYLTLPLGRKRKRLPLVVNVHGGPWARDYWQYTQPESAEVQFLANRGYAVLQVNFRGSAGYGRSFWEKGFKQWGRAMQRDVTDGVQWLIKRRIADPNRIAIYGKSYGGYAVLAGISFTPDLYKAAIDYAGVSNLLTWMGKIPTYDNPLLDELYAKVGDPKKDRDWLAAVSPALHADKIKAPLFIAHGANDPFASKTESDQMVAALLAVPGGYDVDVEYMVKKNEGHIFQNEENKIAFYKAMEVFLEEHLR